MSTRYRGLWLAVVVFAALVLVGGACTKKPDAQISVAGVTNLDSLTLRDNLVVGKASSLGSGGLAVTGNLSLSNGSLINTKGAVTVTDKLLVTSQIDAANGLSVAGYVTMSNGALVNSNGAVTVTDQLQVDSQLMAKNGIASTGGITMASGSSLVMAAGSIWDDSRYVYVLDDLNVGGALGVSGVISDSGTMLRFDDSGLFTGTLGVSSQLIAANGIAAAGGISSTGLVSVTNWGLFYGVALQPAVTQVVTANYGITPTNYSVMYLADDGAQATGTIALDTTVSIVNGTYPGQLLLVFWMDADGATLTIQDGGNMQGPSNADVVLGYQDSALFMWDALSSDWLCINVTDL